MKCQARIEKELWGKACDVKYIKSYYKEDFISKFEELTSNGYNIIWKTFEGLILRYKWNDTDIVVLTCKAPIDKSWYESNKTFIAVDNQKDNREVL